ncbi:MAG: GNAT family N-acetyltransferase [Clostridia bacterium]
MKLIKSTKADFPKIMEIINSAKKHLKDQGINQWQQVYPNEETIEQDFNISKGYVLVDGDDILAYVYIDFDIDPDYNVIEGAWKNDGNYGSLHRVAMSGKHRGKGLSENIFKLACEIGKAQGVLSMRIDTHEDNKKMQHVLQKNGFEYCGIVYVRGLKRMSFEKII